MICPMRFSQEPEIGDNDKKFYDHQCIDGCAWRLQLSDGQGACAIAILASVQDHLSGLVKLTVQS